MSITNVHDLARAPVEMVPWTKTATRTTIAGAWFSLFDLAGLPGAGTFAVPNTTTGRVPTDAVAGFPAITAFNGGASGFLSKFDAANSVACRMSVYDRLWDDGFTFNSNTTLSSQASYASRLPGGLVRNIELWLETTTAFTGNPTITIGYTDETDTARSVVFSPGLAPTLGRCMQIPLNGGNSFKLITSVVATVATVGAFNLFLGRRLARARIKMANDESNQGWTQTALSQIYDTSALFAMIATDSTSSGAPDLTIGIGNV